MGVSTVHLSVEKLETRQIPGGLLACQPNLVGEFQVSERSCSPPPQKKVCVGGSCLKTVDIYVHNTLHGIPNFKLDLNDYEFEIGSPELVCEPYCFSCLYSVTCLRRLVLDHSRSPTVGPGLGTEDSCCSQETHSLGGPNTKTGCGKGRKSQRCPCGFLCLRDPSPSSWEASWRTWWLTEQLARTA